MIYYLVYKIHYDPIENTYNKILGFKSKINDDSILSFIKPISIKPIENVGLTRHTCFYAMINPTTNQYLTIDDIGDALNLLLPLNYTIDEILTRIEVKRMKYLVYVLNK